MDKSLDDIIKTKNIKPSFGKRASVVNLKNNKNIKTISSQNKKPFLSTNSKIQNNKKTIPYKSKPIIQDARQKLEQKSRNNNTITDARQKLVQKDARFKLNKLGIIKKPKDLRGKLNLRSRNILGRNSPLNVMNTPINIIQRTIKGDPQPIYRSTAPPPRTAPLFRTISNNTYGGNMYTAAPPPYLQKPDWSYMDLDSADEVIRPISPPDSVLFRSMSSNNVYYNPMEAIQSSRTIINDQYDELDILDRNGGGSSQRLRSHVGGEQLHLRSHVGGEQLHLHSNNRSLSNQMKARLISNPSPPPRSMGILSHATDSINKPMGGGGGGGGVQSQGHSLNQSNKTKAVTEPGYRIVVSNLKDTVNNIDIKELFEDIGALLISRVVRPGTAEVIYKSQKDAIKAVETYHNRQLDGQPMKCMLVTPRATSNPLIPATLKLAGATKATAVQPDMVAIHKALFNRAH